jgi:hypothetical protein
VADEAKRGEGGKAKVARKKAAPGVKVPPVETEEGWAPVVTEGGPVFGNGQPLQPWAFEAYSAHYGRGQSLNSLAKAYNASWLCVRRNLNAVHAFIIAMEGTDLLDALTKHKTRLHETMKAAWQDHAAADPSNRAPFLRIALDAGEKLAAAEGVVTERKGVQVGEDPANPFHDHGSEAADKLLTLLAGRTGEPAGE